MAAWNQSYGSHSWASLTNALGVRYIGNVPLLSRIALVYLIFDHYDSETGNRRAGLQHILEEHSREFSRFEPQQLTELAEASTSIGLPMGVQGNARRGRPIFGLFFYGEPLGVAVQVGSNGFVVSMNQKSLDQQARLNPEHGTLSELKALLERSHHWPV